MRARKRHAPATERKSDRKIPPEFPQKTQAKPPFSGSSPAGPGGGFKGQRRPGARSGGKSGGKSEGPLWLYGRHAVLAALANPERRNRRWLATAQALADAGPVQNPQNLAPEVVDRSRIDVLLPAGAVHQGTALLTEPLPAQDFEAICRACVEGPTARERSRVLVLDQVEDPQNVGAILRSAAAFGAAAVILTERHAAPLTGALAKAASGALERVPLCRVGNLARALERLAELGYWRVGLDAGAERDLAGVLQGVAHVALVMGAEGAGLRRLTAEKCDFLARLPMARGSESLNVSAAAAIALYEAARAAKP